MSQNQVDVENNELVSSYLLHESRMQSKVYTTIALFRNSVTTRINSFLTYLRITTRANYLVSALNTNFLVHIEADGGGDFYVSGGMVMYGSWSKTGEDITSYVSCGTGNPTSSTSLSTKLDSINFDNHIQWEAPLLNSSFVNGFFTACTPFEAVLQSTLDCLYDSNCLQLLYDHFPRLNQV